MNRRKDIFIGIALALGVVAIGVLLSMVLGFFPRGIESQSTETEVIVTEVETEVTKTDLDREIKVELMTAIMARELGASADVNYDDKSEMVTILFTDPELIKGILLLSVGDLPMTLWDDLKDSMLGLSEVIHEHAEGVSLVLLNPSNPDKYILIIQNGLVIYDVFGE